MPPRLVLILSENHTLLPPRDLGGLVDMAVEAEAAGFDAVMVSEHVVLGPGADADGTPMNPRDYALPSNQDPATPWPDALVLLSAVAAAHDPAPARRELDHRAAPAPARCSRSSWRRSTCCPRDGSSSSPPSSWHRAEYEALDVPFDRRGDLLDEHLKAWRALWSATPASFHGERYRFADVWLEPKPFREGGPQLWFGGQRLHERLLRRLVGYGSGFDPLGSPTDEELERLRTAMAEAGRDPAELEMVGGTRGRFTDATTTADLDEALASIPSQLARGFTTICIKPSQFVDEPAEIGGFCREVVERVAALVR